MYAWFFGFFLWYQWAASVGSSSVTSCINWQVPCVDIGGPLCTVGDTCIALQARCCWKYVTECAFVTE
jgi:hypothetical protein